MLRRHYHKCNQDEDEQSDVQYAGDHLEPRDYSEGVDMDETLEGHA